MVVPVWASGGERTAIVVPASDAVASPRNALRKLGVPDEGAPADAICVGVAASVVRPAWRLRERAVVAGEGGCTVAVVAACDMMKA